MMMKIAVILCMALLLVSCGGTKPPVQKPLQLKSDKAEKAVDHYLNGALYDFRDHYKAALMEYRRALAYDSTSARILMAIGRDFYRIEQYQDAIDYLKRSMKHDSRNKETLYYLAEAYYRLRDYEEAVVFYEKAHEIDPYNSTVQANLLYLYSKLGQVDKLIKFREKMVDMFGYEDESVYQLLTLYMQTNKLEKARTLILKLIEDNPQKPDNWVVYGNILEMDDDTTGAIHAYQKAVKLSPKSEKTLNQLYLLYFHRQDWQGMIDTFSGIVSEDSTNYRARLFLAEAFFYSEDFQKARQMLQPLLAEGDLKERAHLLMGRIAASQNLFEEAKANFRELTRLEPWNARAWEFLAIIHFQEQNYEECAAILEDALSRVSNDPGLLSLYGNALQQLNRYKDALKPLQKAYELDPHDLNTIVSLGVVYDELNMYAPLDSLYEAALTVFPDNALLLNNYSYSLSERGMQLKRALNMAQQAVSKEPDNDAYLDTIGWIYYQLGDYENALQYIQRAVNSSDRSAEVIEHLGDVHYQLGNIDDAKKYWREAFEMDPNNEGLKSKLQP